MTKVSRAQYHKTLLLDEHIEEWVEKQLQLRPYSNKAVILREAIYRGIEVIDKQDDGHRSHLILEILRTRPDFNINQLEEAINRLFASGNPIDTASVLG